MLLEILFKDFILNLNKRYQKTYTERGEDVPYSFDFKIGKFQNELSIGEDKVTKNFRTLRIYANDYKTNERFEIEEIHYIAQKPTDFIGKTYKERLYKDFLMNCFSIGVVNKLNIKLKDKVIQE